MLHNRLGLSNSGANGVPHPSDRAIIVIFVVGGISLKEAMQVQQQLDEFYNQSNSHSLTKFTAAESRPRIVLMSNKIVNAEDVLHMLFL